MTAVSAVMEFAQKKTEKATKKLKDYRNEKEEVDAKRRVKSNWPSTRTREVKSKLFR